MASNSYHKELKVNAEFMQSEEDSDDEQEARAAHSNTERDGIMKSRPKYLLEDKDRTFETPSNPDNIVVEVNCNIRALTLHADTYELETFKKNVLIIFNHINVDTYEPRLGTGVDVKNLTETYKKLFNFEIEEHPDYTKDKIFSTFAKFTARDFTDYGCVAVAILTHGSDDGLLCAKDEAYYDSEIIDMLKCDNNPTLLTKPKLVIIQACRGSKTPKAMKVHQATATTKTDVWKEKPKPYTLPVEADTLVLHSSYKGYPSHRNIFQGSWLIETLCDKINKLHATTDFLSIITKVQKEVAIHKSHYVSNRSTQKIDINKQMPVVTSTLTRSLFLRKYEVKPIMTEDDDDIPEFIAKDVAVTTSFSRRESMQSSYIWKLKHFEYISSCLRHYVEDHPDDETAKNYVGVIDTYKNSEDFMPSKEQMLKVMSNHFKKNLNNMSFFKYLYLENFELDDDDFVSVNETTGAK